MRMFVLRFDVTYQLSYTYVLITHDFHFLLALVIYIIIGFKLFLCFLQVGQYFRHKLLVWMPQRMWGVDLRCPDCCNALTRRGVHRVIRKVVDVDGYYLMASEYLGNYHLQF